MKSSRVTLTMADGSTRTIIDTLGKDIRLIDRRFAQIFALIENHPIRPSRLDGEFLWLRQCAGIQESDGETFADTKRFITTTLDKIELHFSRGTLRGPEDRKWKN